jgi:hypothetical protein
MFYLTSLPMICDSAGRIRQTDRQTDTCDTFVKGKTDYQVYLPVMTAADGLFCRYRSRSLYAGQQ